MASARHRRNYDEMKKKVIRTAAQMFLEDGYQSTTIRGIAERSGVEKHSILYVFGEKEAILCELVQLVLEAQFDRVSELMEYKTDDKILFYAVETVLQLYMAESSEHIREMYTVSYSMPNSSKIVYNTITEKLEKIFEEHLPNLEARDFYEFEIAAAGIMRNFITVPCDLFFPMERKVRKFLQTTFRMYRLPEEKIEEAIAFVSKLDFEMIAKETLDGMFDYIDARL
ncbi:MAG: TetR/AcrR family transcriptional regulator [Clostridia bacterium]|nr:TetR/AcrR family transcriptional regulator [Clostridia bacterium]